MANTTLNTRIILCNASTADWGTSTKVLLKGEMAIEITANGVPKIKFGDGVKTFKDLPYAAMTPDEVNAAITKVQASAHTHANKAVLDQIQVALTNALKANYDAAYAHSTSAHAPANAQPNVIESVKVNGTALKVDGKAVDVTVPTKVSQLTNDAGYKTTDNNTTYSLGSPTSAANGATFITLTGSDGSNKQIKLAGSGATTVTTNDKGEVIINSTNTQYTHPNSGVTAGTYRSVTVNAQGHVTAGTNPTTLAGYGITEVPANTITGVIDISHIPASALERVVTVADDAARFKLTTAQVQLGDVVRVTATTKMFFVVDQSKLAEAAGYMEFTAGTAASVPWSGITGKPSTFTPSAHTHAIADVTGLQAALDAKASKDIGTATTAGLTKLYAGTGEATDGTMTRTAITTALASKANANHNHDDLYFKKGSDVDLSARALLNANKLELNGGGDTRANITLENAKLALGYKSSPDAAAASVEITGVADPTAGTSAANKSYVDRQIGGAKEVIDAYADWDSDLRKIRLYTDTTKKTEITTGEAGKLYVQISGKQIFKWDNISKVFTTAANVLNLGETAADAYRGDRGKIAYDHSQSAHAPANAQKNVQSDWNITDANSDAFIKNKPTSLPANGGNAATVNGHKVESDVPANAVFTDTKPVQMRGATGEAAGSAGYVPAPGKGETAKFLRGDGAWANMTTDYITNGVNALILNGGGAV